MTGTKQRYLLVSRRDRSGALNLLHSIIEWARHPAQAFLSHDPLLEQKRLKLARREAEFLEDEDMVNLLDAVAGSPEEAATVACALLSGLRSPSGLPPVESAGPFFSCQVPEGNG